MDIHVSEADFNKLQSIIRGEPPPDAFVTWKDAGITWVQAPGTGAYTTITQMEAWGIREVSTRFDPRRTFFYLD